MLNFEFREFNLLIESYFLPCNSIKMFPLAIIGFKNLLEYIVEAK